MFKKLLLPVDLNDPGTLARPLAYAVAHCQAFGGKLLMMTVLPEFGAGVVESYFPRDFSERARSDAEKRLQALAEKDVPAELLAGTVIRKGTIYEEILSAARDEGVDLIVMGSHRPELADYLLGPNAARVVRHSPGSVMVVRG